MDGGPGGRLVEEISCLDPGDSHRHRDLRSRFCSLRRIQGDGNCFYRAFCFAHLESILHNARALTRFKEKILLSSQALISAGFDEGSYKQHLNTVVDVIEHCEVEDEEQTLLRLFNDPPTSDSIVQFLRLLASAHLQNHSHFFSSFVEAADLRTYCRQEVEAMAMECDHVEILALLQALDVCIHIVSMEGDQEQLFDHILPEGGEPSLHLLYQTSHYNILYPYAAPPLPDLPL